MNKPLMYVELLPDDFRNQYLHPLCRAVFHRHGRRERVRYVETIDQYQRLLNAATKAEIIREEFGLRLWPADKYVRRTMAMVRGEHEDTRLYDSTRQADYYYQEVE